MRHLRAEKRLGRTTSHRKALMRNLVTSLFEHGQIKTTLAKAKAMRSDVDRMITLGKRQDPNKKLHAFRQILSFVKSKAVAAKIMDEYAELYKDRQGGYTRIFRLNNRLGDNAAMAIIQLVNHNVKNEDTQEDEKILEEVQEEVQEAQAADATNEQ